MNHRSRYWSTGVSAILMSYPLSPLKFKEKHNCTVYFIFYYLYGQYLFTTWIEIVNESMSEWVTVKPGN